MEIKIWYLISSVSHPYLHFSDQDPATPHPPGRSLREYLWIPQTPKRPKPFLLTLNLLREGWSWHHCRKRRWTRSGPMVFMASTVPNSMHTEHLVCVYLNALLCGIYNKEWTHLCSWKESHFVIKKVVYLMHIPMSFYMLGMVGMAPSLRVKELAWFALWYVQSTPKSNPFQPKLPACFINVCQVNDQNYLIMKALSTKSND